jgi:hypothetical protein
MTVRVWLRAFRRYRGSERTTGWLACESTADAFAMRKDFRRLGWRVRIKVRRGR